MKNLDLHPIIKDWPYDPDKITVRKIVGEDRKEKIQMRVDLGVLQMETVGRPDGQRPNDYESYLHYHLERLEDYARRNGTEVGFELTSEECKNLREEAFMYYQRYLSEFVLEDFEAVVRDTARNLQVLDLCLNCGSDEHDRFSMEQYRPYIVMMNSRASALLAERDNDLQEAFRIVDQGLETIHAFFEKYGQPEAYSEAQEVLVLQAVRKDLQGKMPRTPMDQLEQDLADAVAEERFEEAARLRDELRKLRDAPRPQIPEP
jgi:hypothetical protein